MKSLIDNWEDGLSYLFTDDLNSFYTFFTVILAECSYLWAFCESTIALRSTIILLGYMLNVIILAPLKGLSEGTKLEKISSILYVVIFCLLFIVGCIISPKMTIILTLILFLITALCIFIRNHQDSVYAPTGFSKTTLAINKLFKNKIFWVLSQIIVICGPFIAFTIFFVQITNIPISLKIIIPVLYLILSPFIAYFEDESAACNIFELAYDVTWDEEFEKKRNEDL